MDFVGGDFEATTVSRGVFDFFDVGDEGVEDGCVPLIKKNRQYLQVAWKLPGGQLQGADKNSTHMKLWECFKRSRDKSSSYKSMVLDADLTRASLFCVRVGVF